jgi:hypothetical protein
VSYTIDFFELMWLAESVIPERPISRSMCFDDFSERHYHNMNEQQRKQFMEHVMEQPGFDLNKPQCAHFYARFNPENQYRVTTMYEGVAGTIDCYYWEGKYHTQMNRHVSPEFITNIIRIHDNKEIKP